MNSLTSKSLDERAMNTSQIMKDLQTKHEDKQKKKISSFTDAMDKLRTRILKETDIHEKAMIQSPSFEMTRRMNAVVTKEREYKEISERYKTKKINIDEHFDKRIKDAIERLNKEREESHESLEKEYNGSDGMNGKIANAKDWLENCKIRLQQEKDKKPKQLLSLEFDYKKLLQDYYNEFKDRPAYYFKFLESNDLPKDALEEEKPVVEEVDPAIAAVLKMEAENILQREQHQARAREQAKKEQEEQSFYSNARTIYGDISQLEQTKKPLTTPPPSVHNQEDSEQEQEDEEEDEEQAKKDLEDYYRRQQALKSTTSNTSSTVKKSQETHHKPTAAIPPPVVIQKKKSIVNRIIQEKAPGVGTYGLP